jgi:hypothetical protein
MRFLISILSLILMTAVVFAQPDTLWTWIFGGSYYDWGKDVQQTTDGGYVIAGGVDGPLIGEACLIKIDSNGDSLWTRTYRQGYNSSASSVQQTTDGGYIITGYENYPPINTGSVLLIRTNSNGDILWTRFFGEGDMSLGNSVQQTTDGGYIIAGTCHIYMMGPSGRLYLVKTDSDGDTLWTRTFSEFVSRGESVRQTTDGGYIVAGYLNGAVLLVKTESNGDILWTRTFWGNDYDYGYSVRQDTTDGGYIIAGYTESYGAGSGDVWLIKTDSDGDTLWTRTFGGSEDDRGYSVQQTADGGFIVTGYTESYGAGGRDVWLIKTDFNGDSLWSCTVGGVSDDEGYSVQQTTDGGYIVSGTTLSYGAGVYDIWLIRFESETPVEIEPALRLPDEFRLYLNYPNPFNASTVLRYGLPQPGAVTLTIYNVLGRKVASLFDGMQQTGYHAVTWDAADVASGIYFARLRSTDQIKTIKMVLMK